MNRNQIYPARVTRVGPFRRIGRRLRPGTVLFALLLLAIVWLWALTGVTQAAEFGSPPGIDVARQEEQLRAEVMVKAKDLVGPGLVDVIVNVAYAKKESGRTGEKVKLPGFDRFITMGAENKLDIQAEYLRLRQIFVVVDDSLSADKERIERELNADGKFVRANGDTLRVITLSDSGGLIKTGEEKRKEDGGTADKPKRKRRRGPARPGGPTNEPESTVHLLRARTAYFKEDYNRALDHILNAIEVEPKSAQAYAMLGSLYYTINWKNLAVKYWEVSLDLDPDNRELDDLVANIKNSN